MYRFRALSPRQGRWRHVEAIAPLATLIGAQSAGMTWLHRLRSRRRGPSPNRPKRTASRPRSPMGSRTGVTPGFARLCEGSDACALYLSYTFQTSSRTLSALLLPSSYCATRHAGPGVLPTSSPLLLRPTPRRVPRTYAAAIVCGQSNTLSRSLKSHFPS